ncbi:MAG: phosphoribosylformylglycinamidine synthase II, partial [Candidatus Thermoplasmatota archaeon]|nr:phosphoribosylformylglycinamidine synthase II [Candidatus Thermoplasmatota archaeon]
EGYVAACHDVSSGGLADCLAEMTMGGTGAEVCLYGMGDLRTDVKLFSESNTRWVAEVKKDAADAFEALLGDVPCLQLGTATGEHLTVYDGDDMHRYVHLTAAELRQRWQALLPDMMG